METHVNSTPTVTTRSVGIRFGLIGSLISIAYFLILNVSGIDMTSGFWNWFGYAITLALLVLAHKQFKDKGDGFMSYGQGMGITFWMGLVSGLISSVFTYLYIKFIDTGFIEMVKQRQIEALHEQGMSEQQIDQAMKITSMLTTPEGMFLSMLIGSIIIALIIGLFVTIFTQKRNPEPAF
jgi:hypothetical protein